MKVDKGKDSTIIRVLGFFMAFILLLGLVILLFPTQQAVAQTTIYVDDNNTGGPWDGTQAHPYQNIQDGIDAAVSGDTVLVAAGSYYENIVMKDGVEVLGDGASISHSEFPLPDEINKPAVTAIGVDSAAKLDGFIIERVYIGRRISYSYLKYIVEANLIRAQGRFFDRY